MSDFVPPRVRLVAARHGRQLAVAFALLGLVALALSGSVVTNSAATTVTEQRNVQSVESTVETSAVVASNDSLWEAGTRLENNPRYLKNDTPVLTITPTTTAPDGTSVTHEVRLGTRATADGEVFWEESETLVSETTTATNGTATSNATVDIRELDRRLNRTATRLSNVGTMEVRLHLVTTYDTGDYVGEITATAPLEVTRNAYWVDGDVAAQQTHQTPVTRESSSSPDYATAMLLFAGSTGAFAASAILWLRREDAVDVDAIRQEIHERRHEEWISKGAIPMWMDKDHVQLDTLEDVVDVAIDANQRVIHDPRWDLFAVIEGDMIYYYCKNGSWEQMAWPSVDSMEPSNVEGIESSGVGTESSPGGGRGAPPDPDDEDAWEQL
ncbi:DUF5305 domain-containing protein [Halostella sp. PRR32]|uniref:DUF5305 domain-containing protein n=1 Tax=Halostella sp. PRR32 TaxID=3098147 RepID=UPI002B1E8CA3|nr:DUF5305 domain-containing protein [Halostella sp. PRR32]